MLLMQQGQEEVLGVQTVVARLEGQAQGEEGRGCHSGKGSVEVSGGAEGLGGGQ